MPFISGLVGHQVADLDGVLIGNLKELLANFQGDIPLPKIVALEVKRGNQSRIIPINDVTVLIAPAVSLNKRQADLSTYIPSPDDMYLIRDVLDKQIIDTNGVRVVRVNDLELTRVNGGIFVANVDISGAALIRRLGLSGVSRRLANRVGRGSQPGSISWVDVELIASDQPLRLKVPSEKITELHPADLADILTDLTRQEGREFLESLDLETLADTLEEVEPDFQASLVEGMPDERVADVLEEMEPDEAADLLAELPEERSQELLELMEDDEADEVRKLLTYPDDSAGGIMTTEFIAVSGPHCRAGDRIAERTGPGSRIHLLCFCYRSGGQAGRGIFAPRAGYFSTDIKVSDLMVKRVVSVHLKTARMTALRSLPNMTWLRSR